MSREDYEVFDILRKQKQERRNKRLARTDDFGWSKHNSTHWWRMVDGVKLHYWPSANKWLYGGVYYRGALPKHILSAVEADNARLREEV